MPTMDVDTLEEQQDKAQGMLLAVADTLSQPSPSAEDVAAAAVTIRRGTRLLVAASNAQVRVARGRADAVVGHGLVPAVTLLLAIFAVTWLVLVPRTALPPGASPHPSLFDPAKPWHANAWSGLVASLDPFVPVDLIDAFLTDTTAPTVDDAGDVAAVNAGDVAADDVGNVAADDAGNVGNPWGWDQELPVLDSARVLERIRSNGVYNVTVASERGPLLLIEDFLTADECAHVIELSIAQGLERSTVVTGMDGGTFERTATQVRTSSNTWCMPPCYDDPVIRRLDERIAQMVAVPSRLYSEHFQLLRYEPGEYYHEHHDFIPSMVGVPGSYRTFTVFIYLNDVADGGETAFTDLGIAVTPKAGRAVIWPNTAPGLDPVQHPDTAHEARAVGPGSIKYAMNKWVHAADFITPWMNGGAP